MPALYWRESDQQMPEGSRIIGVARTSSARADYVAQVEAACRRHVGDGFDPAVFARFARGSPTCRSTWPTREHWAELAEALAGGEDRPRLFYLATSPDLFGPISEGAGAAGIVTPAGARRAGKADRPRPRLGDPDQRPGRPGLQRVAGLPHRPLSRARRSVQNLLALRFANSLFEAVWNRAHIDHVQITVAETVGRRGARRPTTTSPARCATWCRTTCCSCSASSPWSRRPRWTADSVRDEKLKVLRSLRADRPTARSLQKTVRGQYRAGAGGGMAVPGYAEELGAPSRTETFVALKAEVENWRWAGMPFYLRTGKRLPTRVSEIVIQFHKVPHSIFPPGVGAGRAQPADHPPAARRRHPAGADGQGSRPRRHAPAQRTARHPLRRRVQGPLPGRLRAPADGRRARQRHPVHAPRRGRGGVALGRADPRGLGHAARSRPSPISPAAGDPPPRSR